MKKSILELNLWATWATWYTWAMDVHIRGINDRIWRAIRIKSIKDGITVAQLIEDMWATRATSSPSKRIARNTPELKRKKESYSPPMLEDKNPYHGEYYGTKY